MVFTRREPNNFNNIFPCVFVSPYRRASGTTGAVGSRGPGRKDSATGGIVVVFSCATLVTIIFLSRLNVHSIVGELKEKKTKRTCTRARTHACIFCLNTHTRTCNIFIYFRFPKRFSIKTIFQTSIAVDVRTHIGALCDYNNNNNIELTVVAGAHPIRPILPTTNPLITNFPMIVKTFSRYYCFSHNDFVP